MTDRQAGHRPLVAVFISLLLLLFGGMEWVLLGSYRESQVVMRTFQNAADSTTSLANAQSESLRLAMLIKAMRTQDDLDAIELHLGLTERQLTVTLGQAQSAALALEARNALQRLERVTALVARARAHASPRPLRAEMIELVAPLDEILKVRFDEEEHKLYRALTAELSGRRSQQLLLAILGGVVLALGLALTFVVRSTIRSRLARANHALTAEMLQRRALQEELYEQATRDSLTGLSNRLHFHTQVSEALDADHDIAVAFIDLDGFKHINDAYGHAAGDAALRASAERLKAATRHDDAIARLGGDEFAILLRGGDAATRAEALATRLAAVLAEPLDWHGHPIRLGASVGVAVSGDGSRLADEILGNADLAMYAVKRDGKGRAGMFTPGMRQEISRRQRLEDDLAEATRRDEMILHYQPIVDLRSRRTVGVEALLRWDHPQDGMLAPVEFLDMAETTGLIVPIGAWVVDQACAQAARWREHLGDEAPWVTVNVSPRQLRHPDLVEDVHAALRAHSLPPEALTIEISEGIVAQEAREVVPTLERLRRLGCGIALDDFGAGQASLSYLRFLPLDVLKIDRSLVAAIDNDESSRNLARAVLQLAQSVGLTAVAEGVENERHQQTLKALGFPMAQGFHFARPSPAEDLMPLLERRQSVA